MIPARAKRPFRVVRRTAILAVRQSVGGGAVQIQAQSPAHEAHVEVVLLGPDLTGTVTVTGTHNDGAQTEDLVFTGPIANDRASDRTCKLFDSVTSITHTGLSDEATTPQIEAYWRGPNGDAVTVNAEVEGCVEGYLEIQTSGWPNQQIGTGADRGWLAVDDWYDTSFRRDDLFIELDADGSDNGNVWQVLGPRPDHLGAYRPHHIELRVQEHKEADSVLRSP